MTVRAATHAGSWYSASSGTLGKQLDSFLKDAPPAVSGARFLIGPHAGYSYAGKTLAETYKAWDTSKVKRVFIMGPSHRVYFKNVAYLSGASEYETPFGNLSVDTTIVKKLLKHGVFKTMDMVTDENEHSFEMHAPYVYKLTESLPQGVPTIIPIMISSGDEGFMSEVSQVLSEYLKDEENTFVISSDFCHWGSRFGYTMYTPSGSLDDLSELSSHSRIPSSMLKIYKSIEFLDKKATEIASQGSSKRWKLYIKSTGNTICGQKPISILLQTIEVVREEEGHSDDWAKLKWIGYAQSNKVISPSDSSVSYASGYAVA